MSDTVGTLKYVWKIKNLSTLRAQRIYSDVFSLGPYKWKICAFPKGYNEDKRLLIYLAVADSETLLSGWSVKASYSFTVVDQIHRISSFTPSIVTLVEFNMEHRAWGPPSFISLEELHDPRKGFLVGDTCIIKVDVIINYIQSIIARKQTNKEDDLVKNATEKDIDAFFGDLNSVIFPTKVVSLEEEAKKALAIIEDALSMVPADVNNPYNIYQLEYAFDVLSSLDDCSVLTLEQKAKLLSMKDKFIALLERAANVVKIMKMFTEKELAKKTLDHKLRRRLIEFEKTKIETKKSDQNIVILQEQVDSFLTQIDETRKKRENLMSKQREVFKVSMELKAERDTLVKSFPEFEAEMKAAEEEEKMVSMEWDEMKELVLSVKKAM